jgi:hypothetical protein
MDQNEAFLKCFHYSTKYSGVFSSIFPLQMGSQSHLSQVLVNDWIGRILQILPFIITGFDLNKCVKIPPSLA